MRRNNPTVNKCVAVWLVQLLKVVFCMGLGLPIGIARGGIGAACAQSDLPSGGEDWFGVEIVSADGPFGPAPYDDPKSLLGGPATEFYDPLAELWGGMPVRKVKLVEGACYTDPTGAEKLVTTLGNGAHVVIRFGQPVRDDPAHPYGIDLIVFGNAFFQAAGFADDNSDFNALTLTGGCFEEPLKVSVSPGYEGRPGQSATDWRTWDWYSYENGPYADGMFPTQAYFWDKTNRIWTDRLMDFRKPVNPALAELFQSASANGLSVADAIDLYDGSGGGTGFDLRESGFDEIRYVKIEGGPVMAGGEIDAVAAVRPMALGDSLTIAPANLGWDAAKLVFQKIDGPCTTAVAIDFKSISALARVSTAGVEDLSALPLTGAEVMLAVDIAVKPIISVEPVSFEADITFCVGSDYAGRGNDLELFGWTETGWAQMSCEFDASMSGLTVKGVKSLSRYLLLRVRGPRLAVDRQADRVLVGFPGTSGRAYTLERTTDFNEWNPIHRVVLNKPNLLLFEDSTASAGKAFYRVRVERENPGEQGIDSMQ